MSLGTALIVLALVATCTAHLCLGYWIGMSRGSTSAEQFAANKRLVLLEDIISQLEKRLSEAEGLRTDVARVNETCRALQPSLPTTLLTDLGHLVDNTGRLSEGLHDTVEQYQHTYDNELWADKQRKHAGAALHRPLSSTQAGRQLRDYIADGKMTTVSQHRLSQWTTEVEGQPCDDSAEPGRFNYTTRQWLAPLENRLPGGEDFVLITCKEITKESITFFADEKPAYTHAIVTLGAENDLTFMLVQLDHSCAVYMLERVWYRVTCNFIKPVDPSLYWWDIRTQRIRNGLERNAQLVSAN